MIISEWLDRVEVCEEAEVDIVLIASVKTEVDSESEDEDEGSEMATVSSHEV